MEEDQDNISFIYFVLCKSFHAHWLLDLTVALTNSIQNIQKRWTDMTSSVLQGIR